MNQYKLKIIEKLLNLLISMGWKPWGKNRNYIHIEEWIIRLIYKNNIWDRWSAYVYSLNDLCSIDSWLWQFVVKNKLYGGYNWTASIKQNEWIWYWEKNFTPQRLEYRLMLSSIQTDKEKFLLDNVKLSK